MAMKVMYVLGCISKQGGLERVLIDKMNYLVSMGCEVTLVTYEQGTHPFIYPLNPQVSHIDTGTRFFLLYKYSYLRRYFKSKRLKRLYRRKLQEIVDVNQPDVIITVTYDLENCDVITKLKSSAKMLIESHSAKSYTKDFTDNRNGLKLLFTNIRLKVQYTKISKFDVLVALTQGDAKAWSGTAKKTVVIPNFITSWPTIFNNHSIVYKRIIAVGRLHRSKGFDMLIESFAMIANRCTEWYVDIFGGGDDKHILEKKIEEYGMQKRIFINPATPDIYSEYKKSDFLVLSSRYEGFGLVLIEAMSCGLPCVAFDCTYGPSDIIVDGFNGLLVKNGDVVDMSKKILWMCNNVDKHKAMGDAARQSSSNYRPEVIMPQWLKLLEE